MHLAQIWQFVTGSAFTAIAIAVLKHFWKLQDQRRISDRKLRDLASIYAEAYEQQSAWIDKVVIELLLLKEQIKGGDGVSWKQLAARLAIYQDTRPNFLLQAHERFKRHIPELQEYIPDLESDAGQGDD